MYDLIIKNGYVVSPSSTVQCDVAVQGRMIAGLGHYEETEICRVHTGGHCGYRKNGRERDSHFQDVYDL